MRWPGAGGVNSLDFTGWWRSDYESWFQDCRFYDSISGIQGGAILASKDSESFALIKEGP